MIHLPAIARCAIAVATLAATIATPLAALAAPAVALDSSVFVERVRGGNVRSLEPASRLTRGDRVVTIVTWQVMGQRTGGNSAFTVTNPLPRSVAFQDSASEGEEVSVDGGRTWGQLGMIRVREGGVERFATAEDVTHIRWQVPAHRAAQGSGRIAYSAIVR